MTNVSALTAPSSAVGHKLKYLSFFFCSTCRYTENTLCGDTTLVLHRACFQIQINLLMHQNTFSDVSIVSSLPSNKEFNEKPEGSKYICDIQVVSLFAL